MGAVVAICKLSIPEIAYCTTYNTEIYTNLTYIGKRDNSGLCLFFSRQTYRTTIQQHRNTYVFNFKNLIKSRRFYSSYFTGITGNHYTNYLQTEKSNTHLKDFRSYLEYES